MLCRACFLMFKHWFCWKYQYNKYMFCIYLILLTLTVLFLWVVVWIRIPVHGFARVPIMLFINKKHAEHNIHRLAWSPYTQAPMATAQHALRRHWLSPLTLWVWILLMVRCTRYLMWYIPIYRVPFYFNINMIHELLTLCMPFRYTLDKPYSSTFSENTN
jgi:hypothetical protein